MTSLPSHSSSRRRVSILGATGSIGDSSLRVIAAHPDKFEIVALTAQDNAEKLIQLALTHRPRAVVIGNPFKFEEVKSALAVHNINVLSGESGLDEAADMPVDIAVAAIVGAAGLRPVMRAISQGKTLALANKEALVCAGNLVMEACARHGTTLLPIDSEHNAIFQVLATAHRGVLEHVTLTASGGPLLNHSIAQLQKVTPEEAIRHPRWKMGAKISIDSATMVNKGLELIEAHYLFGLPSSQIEVVIHPESIVHSLVHYADGSVLAQLGMPDMAIPISYALGWPERLAIEAPRLNLTALKALNFMAVDPLRFPAIALARAALEAGPAAMIALNAANEVAVAAFLAGDIAFTQIVETVTAVVEETTLLPIPTIDAVMQADAAARAKALNRLKRD